MPGLEPTRPNRALVHGPRHCSHKRRSMASLLFERGSPHRAQPRGLGKSRHQCISWAASGADDTSPCCEQSNLLRIAPSIRPVACKREGWTRGRFHWTLSLSRLRSKIQGLSQAYAQFTCFHGNTASAFRRHRGGRGSPGSSSPRRFVAEQGRRPRRPDRGRPRARPNRLAPRSAIRGHHAPEEVQAVGAAVERRIGS